MTTTLEKFAGAKRENYCTLPTIDVEIIDPASLCGAKHLVDGVFTPCFKPIVDTGETTTWGDPAYGHADGSNAGEYVAHSTRCSYCGTNDPSLVKYRQHAWYDAVECERCGGVSGYGIGD